MPSRCPHDCGGGGGGATLSSAASNALISKISGCIRLWMMQEGKKKKELGTVEDARLSLRLS